MPTLAYVFDEGDLSSNVCDGPCPDNVLAISPHQALATGIAIAYALGAVVLAVLVLVRLVRRWRSASPALRRALAPVFGTAALLIGIVFLQNVAGIVSEQASDALNWAVLAAVLLVPLSFLYGLLRSRFGATTRRLVAELSEKRTPEEVQDVLRRALRDPTLELGYLSTELARVRRRLRHGPLEFPEADGNRVATRVGEELVVVHDASLQDQPELEEVLDAARIALERGLSLRSLAASERRAGALLEAIPDSMYRVAADGTFLEFRLGETARLPVDSDDLVGMNVREILSPEASDAVMSRCGARSRTTPSSWSTTRCSGRATRCDTSSRASSGAATTRRLRSSATSPRGSFRSRRSKHSLRDEPRSAGWRSPSRRPSAPRRSSTS